MKKSVLIASAFVAIIFGIIIGIIIHVYNDSVLEGATINQIEDFKKNKGENIIEVSGEDAKTTPNTNIIFETFYSTCNHIKVENNDIEKEDVNKDEEYFKNKYTDWEVRNFSEENVELYKMVSGMCDNHYVVKTKDGFIAIYTLDSAGNQIFKEATEISTQYLPEEDKQLLERGIQVVGEGDLQKVIEDYE